MTSHRINPRITKYFFVVPYTFSMLHLKMMSGISWLGEWYWTWLILLFNQLQIASHVHLRYFFLFFIVIHYSVIISLLYTTEMDWQYHRRSIILFKFNRVSLSRWKYFIRPDEVRFIPELTHLPFWNRLLVYLITSVCYSHCVLCDYWFCTH